MAKAKLKKRDALKALIGYCDNEDFRYNFKGNQTYKYLKKKFNVTFIEQEKIKYLVDYQLEDEAPQHRIAQGEYKEQAIFNLKNDIRLELISLGLEKEESADHANTLKVLEIKKI